MSDAIPNDALDDRLGIVGTAGAGKTYAASGAVERVLRRKGRVIIPDPLGVWYGLRLMPDGVTASPFDVVIFGGPHGDLPITEHAGGLIGETVAGMAESAIIDLSEFGTKAAERRFMLAFLTALYRKATGEPVHLVFDEADMWAPERLLDKEGEAAKLLGMMETVVRRGRIKGFIPWLISQRPAVLSKNVLSQVDGLVAMKLTSSQDRNAIGAWIEGQADAGQWPAIKAALPTMQKGQGVVWVPGRSILDTATFPVKRTFDSSRTPKRGETVTATLVPLDIPSLRERMASVEAETKENDPKALKAEIATLKRQMAEALSRKIVADPAELENARCQGEEGAWAGIAIWLRSLDATAIHTLVADAEDRMTAARQRVEGLLATITQGPPRKEAVHAAPQVRHVPPQAMAPASRRVVAPYREAAAVETETRLPPGERATLIAVAQYPEGCDRDQLSVLTGYKRASRNTYLARLASRRYVESAGEGTVRATADGIAALGSGYEPLPSGDALRAYWFNRLPPGEKAVLQVAINAYPEAVPRESVDAATGYKRASRNTYISRLAARRLVHAAGPGEIRASDALFGHRR